MEAKFAHISGHKLFPNPANPRGDIFSNHDGLKESIAEMEKVITPLIVGMPDNKGNHVILDGNRRHHFALCVMPDYDFPCIIVDEKEWASDARSIANIVRSDFSPIDKAKALKAMIDGGRTMQETGRAFGMSKGAVCQYVALLKLKPEEQKAIASGAKSFTATRNEKRKGKGTKNGKPAGGRPISKQRSIVIGGFDVLFTKAKVCQIKVKLNAASAEDIAKAFHMDPNQKGSLLDMLA